MRTWDFFPRVRLTCNHPTFRKCNISRCLVFPPSNSSLVTFSSLRKGPPPLEHQLNRLPIGATHLHSLEWAEEVDHRLHRLPDLLVLVPILENLT
jgi:hypothetical protein